jgi:phosphatidylglycerol:prolipoprotein diacylglycerol transferase
VFRIWNGGLTYYGGFLGAVAFSLVYCRARGLSFLRIADITTPSIVLGLAFGRLGCAAAGCCHGKVADDFPLTVTITAADSLSPRFVPLYPVQILSSLGDVAIFVLLVWLRPRLHRRGQLFHSMLVSYGVFRFLVEPLRDDPRGFLEVGDALARAAPSALGWTSGLALSESQVVSLALVVVGAAALLWSMRDRAGAARELPAAAGNPA